MDAAERLAPYLSSAPATSQVALVCRMMLPWCLTEDDNEMSMVKNWPGSLAEGDAPLSGRRNSARPSVGSPK